MLRLCVLGSFRFFDGAAAVELPVGSQRLLAFLALQDRAVSRAATAGALWPEVTESHAYASLRSALSRLDEVTRETLQVSDLELRLAGGVATDIREARLLAHRLLLPGAPLLDADLSAEAIAALSADLLPDWYDDWAVVEAEEWRQLRLHALEALADGLITNGRFGDAAAAALAAVRAEPFRESAHAVLIRVYLAEGNRSEALDAFAHYASILRDELQLEPTPRLRNLVRDL